MFRKKIENLEAVSPVVGVMLMLVVTIIIAAVVSGFAGGLVGNTQTAPQAAIDVRIGYGDVGMGSNGYNMEFELLSGDSMPTKDLAIITYYTNNSGKTFHHEQTATSEATHFVTKYGSEYYIPTPFLNDMRDGYAYATPSKWFGNFTWKTGDIMDTGGSYSEAGLAQMLGISEPDSPYEIGDPDFGTGSVVDVKIMHIPSGKYIYDKEVVVA